MYNNIIQEHMQHFFINKNNIEGNMVRIGGTDFKHIKNVLRMKIGEEILISDDDTASYICEIIEFDDSEVVAKILPKEAIDRELPVEIWVFQGLPKSDKMETIIQKSVELGAFAIVPVVTNRTIVKINKDKEAKKTKRWQTISESAAKQSMRNKIPKVYEPIGFDEAIKMAADFDVRLIPYENEEGFEYTRKVLSNIQDNSKIAIFIGPEGGFEESEIVKAKSLDILPITLGKRILRTETAALTLLSMLIYNLEN
jgi:RNA methyltransferase, RsmE family